MSIGLNILGLSFSIGAVDMGMNIDTRITNQQLNATGYSLIQSQMDIPVKYLNSIFTYQYKINPDVNDLNFELTYNYVTVTNEQKTIESGTDNIFNILDQFINGTFFTNDNKRNEGRSKLNYKHKLGENTDFESGLQTNFSYRNFDLTNKFYNENLQDYIFDNNLTNSFKLRNNVYAGFVSFNSEIEGFSYMLGLRGEYMDRYLDQRTLTETYKFNKMDYFLSVNVSRKIDDHQIQLSYSRRINRPNENMLNPFPFYSDPNIKISGNPELMPEYIDAFELNY